MSDLTVWAVCVGNKYPDAYVLALRDMVAQYLSLPHDFKCITTRSIKGVKTVLPPVPYQSWWSKIGLFYPGIAKGPSLYFDLDVAICGSLDYLADFTQYDFGAPANWAHSGHGGVQSSVMAWAGNWHLPYEAIKPRWPKVTTDFWGDQEFIWSLLGDDWVRIPGVVSYKYHCRKSVPDNASVITFHGEPKNHDVKDPWILPFTSPLIRHISQSMPVGGRAALSATD